MVIDLDEHKYATTDEIFEQEGDTEYEYRTIAKVDEAEEDEGQENGWYVEMDNRWSLWIQKHEDIVPRVGDALILFGEGIGRPIRGIAVNGHVVRYLTREQQEERQRQQAEEWRREKEEAAVRTKDTRDASVAALPEVLRKRIEYFRSHEPNFEVDAEAYELFVCEQAVILANALKTPEAVAEWADLPYEQQKERVPELDEGHSGNTYGWTTYFAKKLVSGDTDGFYPAEE